MAKSNDFSNKVLKDIKKKYDKALDEFAQDIALEIEEGYEFAIDSFYADYNPLWYDRTYSSYLGSSAYALGIYDPANFNVTGDVYTVGTTVSPEYIQGKPYRADTDWVFNRTFVKGIHGINTKQGWGLPQKKQFMRIKEKQLKSYTTYTTNPRAKKTKRGYRVDKNVFTTTKKYYSENPSDVFIVQGKRSVMKKYYGASNNVKFGTISNMVPSPKALVSREFRLLTRKKNMKRMFNEILERKFG